MGKEAFFLETSRIHSSMVCQRALIELFRNAPVFGAGEAFAALAGEGGAGRLDFSKFFEAREHGFGALRVILNWGDVSRLLPENKDLLDCVRSGFAFKIRF